MPASKSLVETAVLEPRAQRIARASTLFQTGVLSDETSDENFILRLNTIVARQFAGAEKNAPENLKLAISLKGELNQHAELVVFGRWLLLDDRPGMKKQGGARRRPLALCPPSLEYLATRPLSPLSAPLRSHD